MEGTYDYIVFIGDTLDTLEPEKAFMTRDEAIQFAMETHVATGLAVEATLMPEWDVDINEVVAQFAPVKH